MTLVFNEEYRQLDELVSDLRKKIKQSKKFERTMAGSTEIYHLDTIRISFLIIGEQKSVIKDASGNKIISIDWHFDQTDELQRAKFNMFGKLLRYTREIHTDRIEQQMILNNAAVKMEQPTKAIKKRKAAEQVKIKIKIRTKNLAEALARLRGL